MTEIEYVLEITNREKSREDNPVKMVSAKNDEGIDELVETVYEYYSRLENNGGLVRKRKNRIEKNFKRIFTEKVHHLMEVQFDFSENIDNWVEMIYSKEVDPYTFMNERINAFIKETELND